MRVALKPFSAALLALALSVPAAGPALADDLVDSIRSLYDAGRFDEAYALAGQHLFDREGEPLFDFYYGVAALDAGAVQEGLFALERVISADPENARVRLEIGRAYYLIGQYDRAKAEFSQVLSGNPPENVRANINRYLEAIDRAEGVYLPKLTAYVEASVGYDSNANTAPGTAEFFTPTLGTGVLSATSLSQHTLFGEAKVGGDYSYPLTRSWKLNANASARMRLNDTAQDFDTSEINLGVGASWTHGDHTVVFNAGYQDYYLDYLRYRDTESVGAEWRYAFNPMTQASLFAQLSNLDYPGNEVLNSKLTTAGVSLTRVLDMQWTPVVFGAFYGLKEDAETDTTTSLAAAQRDGWGASVGTVLTLDAPTSTRLTVSGQVQHSLYQGQNVLFLRSREDDLFSLSVGLAREVMPDLTLSASYAHTVNDSNIVINDYDQDLYTIKLRYEF
ncbi:MAG: surface lipoprotein assembly modifier [Gammaproteobacteria bacterium]